jgi:hypothetical protein
MARGDGSSAPVRGRRENKASPLDHTMVAKSANQVMPDFIPFPVVRGFRI